MRIAIVTDSTADITDAMLNVTIIRTPSPSPGTLGRTLTPDRFEAAWRIEAGTSTVRGTATGEAMLIGRAWHLRGPSSITIGAPADTTVTSTSTTGAFAADIHTNGQPGASNVAIWRIDGFAESTP